MPSTKQNTTQHCRRKPDAPVNSTALVQLTAASGETFGDSPATSAENTSRKAAEFGLPFLDLHAFDISQCPEQLVDTQLLHQHQILPLYKSSRSLVLAVADPTNVRAQNDIKFHTGLHIDLVMVAATPLSKTIERFIAQQEISQPLLQTWHEAELEQVQVTPGNPIDVEESAIDEAPIVRFVNKLLLDAMALKASDIHIEPYERSYRIRIRVDGILRVIAKPPVRFASRIASRIKVMSQLDIAERRLPQDGRIKIQAVGGRAIDVRVNILPTMWGEKIVLRLLDPATARLGIDALGFTQTQKSLFLTALHRSQGLILVTGPTGSGKSVTLYTGLNILNSAERNIATAEDPVELNIDGINQVTANAKAGLDFAAALRAFLRQDPDVIMVGEIRDSETANTAIRAAQTGHLVLSTLHTNSATETISRLLNMEIPPFLLAASISLIIAQKLVRRLCTHCKEKVYYSDKLLEEVGFSLNILPEMPLYRAKGCDQCKQGYKGRVGIFEVVPITPDLSRSIMAGASPAELNDLIADGGHADLRQSALSLVAQGQTSLEEANRFV